MDSTCGKKSERSRCNMLMIRSVELGEGGGLVLPSRFTTCR